MTIWQTMLASKPYNDFSPILFEARVKAKKLTKAYNTTTDEEIALRKSILDDLLEHCGEKVWIEPDFRVEFGRNISIGDHVYINFDCIILDCAEITIGNHVMFGPRIGLYAGNHALDAEERIGGALIAKPITIEENGWLGGDVKVNAGVVIGKNSVIGSGSVVTKNIPPDVLAAGCPCRVIREITEADKIGFIPEMDV